MAFRKLSQGNFRETELRQLQNKLRDGISMGAFHE